MAKELYLYGDINQWSTAELIREMEASKDDDIVLRINSRGGVVTDGWSVIAKFNELQGKKTIKVDGQAASMAFFFLAYADEKPESLDVSEFLLHRAAYGTWFEKSEYFTPELKAGLEAMNDNLKKALEAKIDVAKLKELKGVTLKEVFSMDNRLDVILTAKEAKAIGLIGNIISITPKRKAELEGMFQQVAARSGSFVAPLPELPTSEQNKPSEKNIIMDINKLKAEHPALFAEVMALGVEAEKDRVGAWMAFAEIDAKAVAEGVESGKPMSQKVMAELTLKSVSKTQVAAVVAENPAAPETDPKNAANGEDKNKPKAEVEAFQNEVNNLLNIK